MKTKGSSNVSLPKSEREIKDDYRQPSPVLGDLEAAHMTCEGRDTWRL